MRAKHGMGDRFFALATTGMEKSGSSDRFIMPREDAAPDVLWNIEVFRSVEAKDGYENSPMADELRDEIIGLLAEPPMRIEVHPYSAAPVLPGDVEETARTLFRLAGPMIEVNSKGGRSWARFVVEGTVDEVRARIRAAVESERRFATTGVDAEGGSIVIATRVNWATWGERMTVELSVAGAASTLVDVRVVPVVRTTIVDWGQGDRDIRRLHERIATPDPR